MSRQLIHVDEALRRVMQSAVPTATEVVPLAMAVGRVNVSDVYSGISLPLFNQSNFDGYAFQWQDAVVSLEVKGEIAAGDNRTYEIKPGEAVRIFTGAPVPNGADTIVMQEQVTRSENEIRFTQIPAKGNGVRNAGSDVREGELILPKHTEISPPACTLLAMAGLSELAVYRKPRVAILITGNELFSSGNKLPSGGVYEANSIGLAAACNALLLETVIDYASDSLEEIARKCASLLENCDVLLTCGGVSVGDYDFVPQALQQCGMQAIFHGVNQKPGKPLLFGNAKGKPVFGLPGNPGSAMTCFYYYVKPLLLAMQQLPVPETLSAALVHDFEKKTTLTQLMRAFLNADGITILQAQDSYRMQSFYKANAIAVLPSTATSCKQGDLVAYQKI